MPNNNFTRVYKINLLRLAIYFGLILMSAIFNLFTFHFKVDNPFFRLLTIIYIIVSLIVGLLKYKFVRFTINLTFDNKIQQNRITVFWIDIIGALIIYLLRNVTVSIIVLVMWLIIAYANTLKDIKHDKSHKSSNDDNVIDV